MSPNSKTLSNTVPLIFQWLPQELGATIPNTKDYPYLQRIVDWAAREPQRKIYLVVNWAGLTQDQMTELTTLLSPAENIQVVDFNKISLDKEILLPVGEDVLQTLDHDVIPPGNQEIIILRAANDHNVTQRFVINGGFKLSELLARMYSKDNTDIDNSTLNYLNRILPFAVKLDLMRLSILQNIEKITNTKEAIYLDVDILPEATGKQIGEVKILKDILMSDALLNTQDLYISGLELENSIIAINDLSQPILTEMVCQACKNMVSKLVEVKSVEQMVSFIYKNRVTLSNELILQPMQSTIDDNILAEVLGMTKEQLVNYKQEDLKEYFAKFSQYKEEINEKFKSYKFQESGQVKVTQDNSWKQPIDSTKVLPIDFTELNKILLRTEAKELKNIAQAVGERSRFFSFL